MSMATKKAPAPSVDVDLFTSLVESPGSALVAFDEDGLAPEFLPELTDALRNDPDALILATYQDAQRHLREVVRKIPTSRRPDPEKTYPAAAKTLVAEITRPFHLGAMSAPAPSLAQ